MGNLSAIWIKWIQECKDYLKWQEWISNLWIKKMKKNSKLGWIKITKKSKVQANKFTQEMPIWYGVIFFFFKIFRKKNSQDFHYLDKKPLTWGCLYTLWEVPIARIWKNICGKVFFGVPEIPLLLGVLGAWMTFKKAEMAKTLKNGLIMIETNPLNHNWSHFAILSGLTLHQFQKKLLLSQGQASWSLSLLKYIKKVPGHWFVLFWSKPLLKSNFWFEIRLFLKIEKWKFYILWIIFQ